MQHHKGLCQGHKHPTIRVQNLLVVQTYALPEAPMHEWLTPSCCGYTVRIDPTIWSRGMKVEAIAECPAPPKASHHELWDVYDPDNDPIDLAYWENDDNFKDEQ